MTLFNMHHSSQRGFTILLATLVAAITLAIGLSVYILAQKQVELSRLGRDSQIAFYAADTGAECALYWDFRYGYFATSAPATVTAPNPLCDGESLAVSGRSSTFPYTMTFQFEPNGVCSQVFVTKSATNPRTVIHADGFSTSCANINAIKTLQRTVEIRY